MNAIQLLTKAGQIVDELARLGPSTPAELAKAVDEPRPTVYRIVAALEQLEVVRQTGDGRVELGTALLRWSDAAVESFIDRAELHKQLRWVREQLGMNVYFCVPHDDGVMCLDQVDGAVVDMRELTPGRVLPRHAGAASRALLAFDTPDARAAVLASAPFDAVASGTPVTAVDLDSRLDSTVLLGWSVDDSEIVEGVASVAVPVRRSDGTPAGVVSVAGLSASVLAQEDVAGQVLTIAAEALAAPMTRTRPVGVRVVDQAQTVPSAESRAPALIVKAGALMEALADERTVTSARLTELIDEPVSSVYRMLATLAEIGWVEQIGRRGAYRVGGRVLTLANEFTRRLDIRRAALPVLREIHRATGETTFMCVRHGTRAVCIERIDGIRVNSRVLRLGRSLPLHVGAAPRALLAFEDRESWEEYASAALGEDLLHDVGSRSTLFAELEEIRARGVALSDNTVTPGIAAIGAPIFDHRGEVAASLSLSGLRATVLGQPIDGRSATELVLWGAAEMSRYLGYVPVLPTAGPKPAYTDAPVS